MSYSNAAKNELLRYSKDVEYLLELRSRQPGSDSWQSYAMEDFRLQHEERSPAQLRADLLNTSLSFSNEVDQFTRTRLLAEARLTCRVGAESEVLFRGRIFRIEAQDFGFRIFAQDWLALVNDCECEVDLSPEQTDVIAPAREIMLLQDGAFGNVYGFSYSGSGDPAFNADSNPGSRRRSFAADDIRLWYDAPAAQEVPPLHYQVNLTSGTFTILEDTSGRQYFASGVSCYIEGSLDWAEVFRSALGCAPADGGIGAQPDELDIPDCGIDLAGPLYFRGRVSELLREVWRAQQANMRLWYDSREAVYKLRLVQQKQPGDADHHLFHAQSIAQPREIRDLYSRVVITGKSERPRNVLTESSTSVSDDSSQGDWFNWDGLNIGPDDSFADVASALWDGNLNRAASLHNLAASEGGGSGKYDSWYSFVQIDLGSLQRLSRIRVRLPGSRNLNAQAGHQGMFWPGLRLLGSLDGLRWRLLSAHTAGRFPPLHSIEAQGREILCPRLRYVKVQLGAYKHGTENEEDPSIGLAELELYCDEEYRVVREIDGNALPLSSYSYTADYDQDGSIDEWQRNHPGLWQRLGERHRSLFEDQSGNLNEMLAQDRALDLLAESVRLFQRYNFSAVCDPRVKLYQTVSVEDEINGHSAGFLVERIVLSPAATDIEGSNFLTEALGSIGA